jgi:hypothetical protein
LGVENALNAGVSIVPENSIKLRALLTADVALDILREYH